MLERMLCQYPEHIARTPAHADMIELLSFHTLKASSYPDTALAIAIEVLVTGIFATLATDLWQRLLQTITGLPPVNWGLVGRWVAWMPRGVLVHRPITATAPVCGERVIGGGFHYAVGIVYAALYLAVVRLGLGSGPTLVSAIVFAAALLVVPWFLMQPALGLGFMAARAPRPGATCAINISAHVTFGIGLYVGALAASAVV
jgi:hypothetical protein